MKTSAKIIPLNPWVNAADSARRFLDNFPAIHLIRMHNDLKRAGRKGDPIAGAQADALERHMSGKGCTDTEALGLAWSIHYDLSFCGSKLVN